MNVIIEVREIAPPTNLWDQVSEYDDNESMRSTKKFTQLKKQQPVKRLGWGGGKKQRIISAAKKSISKNM
jgi:hypothetical protein